MYCTSRAAATKSVDSTLSLQSICSTLSLDPAGIISNEYAGLDTDTLVEEALSIIEKTTFTETLLDGFSPKELFRHMLLDAPHPLGKHYIALAFHIAARKGPGEVERLASVLLDNLLFPMLAQMSVLCRDVPNSSQTPTLDDTPAVIEPAERSDQRRLRDALFIREENKCAITGIIDVASPVEELIASGQTIPGVSDLEAAHIISLALNSFGEPNLHRMLDILKNWTNIDLSSLVGPSIETPRNAVLMNHIDHQYHFGKFKIWFEEIPGQPNRYTIKTARGVLLANGKPNGIAQFRSEDDSGIEPPDPQLLRIHTALAKVFQACGASDVYAKWEEDFRRRGVVEGKASLMWLDARLNCTAAAINAVNESQFI